MAQPDVHLTNLVTLEGREYLVDAGYGGPFLAPMPRDLAHDHTIALGREQYVLKPKDGQGRSRLELHRDGQCKHGYDVKPAPRDIGEFAQVIEERSGIPGVISREALAGLELAQDPWG